ncbi:hypothetical protein FA15DRAFT_674421 [Coprinopsis marcescibilis]|uniref:EF-hand n=1 Tax=Coprinopsis marcescibilis TaxID=230819 RepID=A0A5C3KUA2_COPMA|nr:hypothetical protein FA15DRAFT_674421 [Coprinopsis marcescibilis]
MQKPTVSPSPDESALIARILDHAQRQNSDFLTAEEAVDIFNRSGLSRLELRDIWKLSDADRNGRLSQDELAVAIRLMGWMQTGRAFSESLLEKPGPLPTLEGIAPPKLPQKDPSLAHVSSFPPVLPADVTEFYKLFHDAGPVEGFLDGDKIREIFLRSNLAYRDLSSIWLLLDKTNRSRLNFEEFALGMYLIQAIRSCHLTGVPASIPPEVQEKVNRMTETTFQDMQSPFLAPGEAPSTSATHNRSPPPHLSRIATGPPSRTPPPPPGPSSKSPKAPAKPPPIKPKVASKPWVVTPREKEEHDKVFVQLDPDGRGIVDTDFVQEYLRQYKIAEDDLSRILDLVSIRQEPTLSAEEFAVAVHLVHDRLDGKDLPTKRTSSLIPPSLRNNLALLSPDSLSPPPKPTKEHDAASSNSPQPIPNYTDSVPQQVLTDQYNHHPTSDPQQTPWAAPSTSLTSTSTSSFTSFLTENPGTAKRLPSMRPDQMRRKSTSLNSIVSPEEDPLEELKTETKTLRRQIDNLLEQLSSQHEHRSRSEQLQQENSDLKAQIADLESSIASVLTQMQNNDNALSEELTKEIERLSRRVAELEQTEHQLQQTVGILEVAKRDNNVLAGQVRELRNAETTFKSEIEDARHAMEDIEKDNADLKARLSDMTKAMSEPDTAGSARELRVLLKDITRENQSLKERMRETERSMEQMLLSGKGTTQMDELKRENKDLKLQLQDLEQLTAQLQSTQEDNHLQQVLLVVSRENEGMKVRIRDMQSSTATLRSEYDAKLAEMQRKIDELIRENNQLKFQGGSRQGGGADADVPPPAYDDDFLAP